MEIRDDMALVAMSVKGDTSAFEELILRYEKRIVAAAIRLCANREEGEDMAQEAFIKAWRALAGYRGQASFGTWMMAIITNLWRDRLRRNQPPAESIDAVIQGEDGDMSKQYSDDKPGPEEAAEDQDAKQILGRMLESLRPEFKEALVLRDIQGFSYEEVAVITGASLGTVKSRINRGRAALREKVLEYQKQNPGFFRLTKMKDERKSQAGLGHAGSFASGESSDDEQEGAYQNIRDRLEGGSGLDQERKSQVRGGEPREEYHQ